ncbi:hypothetical protein MSPP1_002229 [Malassezia sp. CBS 17886]|nr:hypothetical protein MSPP1_002229 [Malassezia sp. CBS 17886]
MGGQESFKRYVEVGRVVLLNEGAHKDQLAVIIEIVDQNRAIIDATVSGGSRDVLRYRAMTLTPYTIKVPRGASSAVVKKAFSNSGVDGRWARSSWAKTIRAREARKKTTDFERFHVQVLKKERRRLVGAAVKKVQV